LGRRAHAQRAELEARADAERSSISTVVRRFVAAGLAAGILCGIFVLTTLIEITLSRHTGAGEQPRSDARGRR